jgi:hypothetical protein
MSHPNHDTVILKLNGWDIDIDKKISPLISELWEAKIITSNSCEDNVPQGYVWIEFSDANSYQKFIDILFINVKYESDIFKRALSHEDIKDHWIISTNNGTSEDYEDFDESGNLIDLNSVCKKIYLHVSVRFPHKDLNYVYNKIKQYNNITGAAGYRSYCKERINLKITRIES